MSSFSVEILSSTMRQFTLMFSIVVSSISTSHTMETSSSALPHAVSPCFIFTAALDYAFLLSLSPLGGVIGTYLACSSCTYCQRYYAIFSSLITLAIECSSSWPALGGNSAMALLMVSSSMRRFCSCTSISCSFSEKRSMHP